MSKTLQNHQLAYLGEEKRLSGSKNNIKLKWLFPIVSEIVVLFPRMSHFWTEYVIVLHCDEAYLLGIFVGHILYQRIGSGEEFSLTLHFADESWIRNVKWFIQKEAKKRILCWRNRNAPNSTTCCLFLSLFEFNKELQILESDCLCMYPSGPSCHSSAVYPWRSYLLSCFSHSCSVCQQGVIITLASWNVVRNNWVYTRKTLKMLVYIYIHIYASNTHIYIELISLNKLLSIFNIQKRAVNPTEARYFNQSILKKNKSYRVFCNILILKQIQ